MPNHPDPSPAPFLGVEIHCTWPSAAFLACATVAELRQLIRQALAA